VKTRKHNVVGGEAVLVVLDKLYLFLVVKMASVAVTTEVIRCLVEIGKDRYVSG
jgi:hypothetical protein